jgi:hypothetical protein
MSRSRKQASRCSRPKDNSLPSSSSTPYKISLSGGGTFSPTRDFSISEGRRSYIRIAGRSRCRGVQYRGRLAGASASTGRGRSKGNLVVEAELTGEDGKSGGTGAYRWCSRDIRPRRSSRTGAPLANLDGVNRAVVHCSCCCRRLPSPSSVLAQRGPAPDPLVKENTTIRLAPHVRDSDGNAGSCRTSASSSDRARHSSSTRLGRRNGETVLRRRQGEQEHRSVYRLHAFMPSTPRGMSPSLRPRNTSTQRCRRLSSKRAVCRWCSCSQNDRPRRPRF